MAARLRKDHQEEARNKIKTTQLINRLNDIALGNVVADSTQVSAAKALLNKVLPDLKSTELSGVDGRDLIPGSITRKIVRPGDERPND